MNKEEIKNNQIPEEIKDICRSCESNILAQNKGCAFRSLGNEYCDYVLNATKLYLEKDKQLDKYKNVFDKALYWLSENTHYTSLKVDKLVLDKNANLKELLELLEEVK